MSPKWLKEREEGRIEALYDPKLYTNIFPNINIGDAPYTYE